MSEKKFEVSEERLLWIVKLVAECMGEVGLKFPKKGIRECAKVSSCWGGEGLFIEMVTLGRAKNRPEVWFHVCAAIDDDGDMPDVYILSDFAVCGAPWDSFERVWRLDGDLAFVEFNSETNEISGVSWENEHDLDDDEESTPGHKKASVN